MKIQVIGGGSFGLALARRLALNGHALRLWCRDEDGPEALQRDRSSRFYLPELRLPDAVEVNRAVDPEAAMVVWAPPSHALRAVSEQFRFAGGAVQVCATKGIENDTLLRMSQVLAETQPGARIVALSGPSHAEEVARDLPASVVAASLDADAGRMAQKAFISDQFRVYTSPDMIGVELGGALKNVIAIAAGACDGFALGDNAKAALVTRGLAEIARVGVACGADPLTFAGLSGMGDLIATCGSAHSRNRRIGEGVARGKSLEELLGATPMVAEGVRTAAAAHQLAQRERVEMPITAAVHHVLFEDGDPRAAIAALMTRDPKPE